MDAASLGAAVSLDSAGEGELGLRGSTPVSQAANGSVRARAVSPSASLDAGLAAAKVRSVVLFGMPLIITAPVSRPLEDGRTACAVGLL